LGANFVPQTAVLNSMTFTFVLLHNIAIFNFDIKDIFGVDQKFRINILAIT